ncbi:DUF1641 domain-containing protein [Deinococcus metallilatus]|uniref:DUF1641 domain-containing protein n=1 Tax=Deinococcus metallilatus TaxID=1211322 RepID=A0AAJ5F0E6_9DEIO|nr:DUF1641 domain-containing protein [Deinococcus metallilatus]MBB5295354.1 uncharacterized protein YjgD (DUF1641 family) [Deinococcus metallilatus]QBY08107.1 DUF1641 domain-containing protein [Deinococcus metallilatus]RXJ12442.1 DUF1641 domain-containing protein [Deinococcus metallilatus]TLK21075.1 DUF1641 domain-containing protein [Deinococcus metallilatus]GMA16031.1 hypothetical protein GCM10025871_23620 [Deinococcus metallilatus]
MAKPLDFDVLTLLPTPEERLAESTAESAGALVEALELLRVLHEHKVLQTLVRVVQGGEGLTSHALDILNEPGSVRAVRNALEAVKVLGRIEPEALETVTGALSDGLQEGARRVRAGERAGPGELLALVRDPDVGLALGALVGVLRGFGRGLREREAHGHLPEVPQT